MITMRLTNAMGTGVLAIALGSELVALVTGSADSPSDRTRGAGRPASWTVRMLPVLVLGTRPGEMWIVDTYVLL